MRPNLDLKRAYRFEIDIGGMMFVECDQITGISVEREYTEIKDAQGQTYQLPGAIKRTYLELHDVSTKCIRFFNWVTSPNILRLNGNIIIWGESPGDIIQTVYFADMLPEALRLDELNRKNKQFHGQIYAVSCEIVRIT